MLKPSNINKVSFQWQEKSILNVPKNYEKSKIIYIVVVFPTIKMSYNKTVALQNIFKIKTNSNTSYRIKKTFFNAYYLVASILIKSLSSLSYQTPLGALVLLTAEINFFILHNKMLNNSHFRKSALKFTLQGIHTS